MSLRVLALLALLPAVAVPQTGGAIDLTAPGALVGVNTTVTPVTFKGRRAVRVVETQPGADPAAGTLALVAGSRFRNGAIELALAGEPGPGAPESARGFIGLAFRIQPDAARYEYPLSQDDKRSGRRPGATEPQRPVRLPPRVALAEDAQGVPGEGTSPTWIYSPRSGPKSAWKSTARVPAFSSTAPSSRPWSSTTSSRPRPTAVSRSGSTTTRSGISPT